jgi:DNA repair exonuclease SbcCD ATPase subunit
MAVVSYTDVESALADMIHRKLPLTLSNLRVTLGNRGSMSTLSKHFQRWKQEQALVGVPPSRLNPAPEPILAAVQGVWQQIVEKAQQDLEEQKKSFEAQRQKFLIELQEAQQQAQRASEEAKELRHKIQVATALAQQFEQQAQSASHESDLAQQRASQAEDYRLYLERLLQQAIAQLQEYRQQYDKKEIAYQKELERQKQNEIAQWQALREQDEQRHKIEREQWQTAYEELQKRCVAAETLWAQSPSLQSIQQTLEKQHALWHSAALTQNITELKELLLKIPQPYQLTYYSTLKK